MLLYHKTFHLPPVEEHRSMPLQFTWCHWLNQETDTDVRKHYLLHFLFTFYTALTWKPYGQLSLEWWAKLFGYLYELLTAVSLFAGLAVLRDGVLRRRYFLFPVVLVSAIGWGRGKGLRSRDYFGRELSSQSGIVHR